MTQHTPGPWTNDEAGFLGADGRPVGQPDRGVRDPAAMLADFDRVRADRRLMCAAPALLEALRAVERWMDQVGAHAPETRVQIHLAILQAEGGSDG